MLILLSINDVKRFHDTFDNFWILISFDILYECISYTKYHTMIKKIKRFYCIKVNLNNFVRTIYD